MTQVMCNLYAVHCLQIVTFHSILFAVMQVLAHRFVMLAPLVLLHSAGKAADVCSPPGGKEPGHSHPFFVRFLVFRPVCKGLESLLTVTVGDRRFFFIFHFHICFILRFASQLYHTLTARSKSILRTSAACCSVCYFLTIDTEKIVAVSFCAFAISPVLDERVIILFPVLKDQLA